MKKNQNVKFLESQFSIQKGLAILTQVLASKMNFCEGKNFGPEINCGKDELAPIQGIIEHKKTKIIFPPSFLMSHIHMSRR